MQIAFGTVLADDAGRQIKLQLGHSGQIYTVAFSPDDRYLATASADGTARIWEAASGKLIRILRCSREVVSLSWSPDGRFLATGCNERVSVWDWVTEDTPRDLPAGHGINWVGFIDNARLLVGDYHTGDATLWNLNDNTCTSMQWEPTDELGSNWFELSNNREMLASYRMEFGKKDAAAIRVFEIATGKLLTSFEIEEEQVASVAWSPNDDYLASTHKSEKVYRWDIASSRLHSSEEAGPPGGLPISVDWSPDGQRFITGGYYPLIHLWNAEFMEKPMQLSGHQRGITALEWSPDGEFLISGCGAGIVQIRDGVTGRPLCTFEDIGQIQCGAWSIDSRLAAVGNFSGDVTVFQAKLKHSLYTLRSASPISNAKWSADNAFLATSQGNRIAVWDILKGGVDAHYVDGSGAAVTAWHPSELILAMAAEWGSLTLLNLKDVQSKKILEAEEDEDVIYSALEWSPGGRSIAQIGRQRERTLVYKITEDSEPQLLFSGGPIRWLNEDRAVTGGLVWDTSNGICDGPFKETGHHLGKILATAWSPDGKLLATSGDDYTVRLWATDSWQCIRILRGFRNPVDYLDWSENSRELLTKNSGATVQEIATESVGRDLEGRGLDDVAFVWVWKSPTYTRLVPGRPPDNWKFSPDGTTLAVWAEDKFVVYKGDQFEKVGEISAKGRALWAWSVYQQRIVGFYEGELCLWDLTKGIKRSRFDAGVTFEPELLEWSPDGSKIAVLSAEKGVAVWSTTDLEYLGHLALEDIAALRWSPDSNAIAFVAENTCMLWTPGSGNDAVVREFNESATLGWRSWDIVWRPDSTEFILRSEDEVWLFRGDASSHELVIASTPVPEEPVIPHSPDGDYAPRESELMPTYLLGVGHWLESSRLEIVARDGKTIAWDVDKGAKLAKWRPDSRFLAYTDYLKRTLNLWDAKTRQFSRLSGHATDITSIDWSSAGLLSTTSNDGTIRLWNPETKQEFLTIVTLSEEEWVAVSPEGFFDGTVSGLKSLHWTIGNEVVPLESFFLEFYQPGLLSDVIKQNKPISEILKSRDDPRADRKIADIDRRMVRVNFVDSELPPPGEPQKQRTVDFVLEVSQAPPDEENSEGSGLKDVRLFRNGTLVWRSTPGETLDDGQIRVEDVTLVAGANRFSAYAFNNDNVKCPESVLILEGDESLSREPSAYILTIGVDKYENPDLNLRYAGADAAEVAASLTDHLPVRRKNIKSIVLTDEEATKERILRALAEIRETAEPEDIVILSFAGHGVKLDENFYLIPHDCGPKVDARSFAQKGVSNNELEDAFADVQAERIALIIDACHSGQALNAEEWRVGPMNSRGFPQLAWEKGMEILTASQSDETAKELSDLGHGILTSALLKGLEGAPRSDIGLLAPDWLDFAAREVPQLISDKPDYRERFVLATGETRAPLLQTPRVFHGSQNSKNWLISKAKRSMP